MLTEKLQADGVKSFSSSFDQLLAALEKKRNARSAPKRRGKFQSRKNDIQNGDAVKKE